MKGYLSSSDKKNVWDHITAWPLCLAFQRLLQSPVTRLGLRLIRNGGAFSTCLPNTAQLIRSSFMGNYCAVSVSAGIQKKHLLIYSSLSPPSPIFHASISPIVLCNKAEIKRLAGQLLHNESWREPFFASGVAGLQRMWYLDRMRRGFICEGAGLSLASQPYGSPAGDVLRAHTHQRTIDCIIIQSGLSFEWRVLQPTYTLLHVKFQQVLQDTAFPLGFGSQQTNVMSILNIFSEFFPSCVSCFRS